MDCIAIIAKAPRPIWTGEVLVIGDEAGVWSLDVKRQRGQGMRVVISQSDMGVGI